MDDRREARAEGERRFQREGAILSQIAVISFWREHDSYVNKHKQFESGKLFQGLMVSTYEKL